MPDILADSFVLTVAESKRLIARGVRALACVQQALEEGLVIICKGGTNAYVAEELLGRKIAKGSYVLGRTVPQGSDNTGVFKGEMAEVILRQGRPVELTLDEAVAEAKPGDVVIKGANALNYQIGIAGLLVGHPAGGTLGRVIGSCYGKGLHLVIPVGLEKEVVGDIAEMSAQINAQPAVSRPGIPALWPVQGEIVTEIEALEGLTGVEAQQIAAGGICGAEGGIWLAVWGTPEQVEAARAVVEDVQGEPPFAEASGG